MSNQQKPRARARVSGMSMIEVTFALTITTMGLVALLMMQGVALKQGRWGRHTTDAAQIAQDQVEYLIRLPWTAPEVQPGTWTVPTPVMRVVAGKPQLGNTGSYVEQTFNLQQRVTAMADPQLRQIDVRVNWNETDQALGTPGRRYAVSTIKKDES